MFIQSLWKYFYLLLLSMFFLIVGISMSFDWPELGVTVVYMMIMLLVPVYEYGLESLKKNKELSLQSYSLFFFKILALIYTPILCYFLWVSFTDSLCYVFMLWALLFWASSQLAFYFALLLFWFVAFFLVLDNTSFAEKASIYAYYMLVLWVLLEILSPYRCKNSQAPAYIQKIIWSQVIEKMSLKRQQFFYGVFIAWVLALFANFWLQFEHMYLYVALIIIVAYVDFKCLAGKIDFSTYKFSFMSSTFVQLYFLSTSILVIIAHFLFDAYPPWAYTPLVYFVIFFLNLILQWYFFSDFFEKLSNHKKFLQNTSIYAGIGAWVFAIVLLFLNKQQEFAPVQETDSNAVSDQFTWEDNFKISDFEKVSDIYTFRTDIVFGDRWVQVNILQKMLRVLWFYDAEFGFEFDENTRDALQELLVSDCNILEGDGSVLAEFERACLNDIRLESSQTDFQ